MPIPLATPGAVIPGATAAQICVPGYSAHVRNVSSATIRQVFLAYQLPYPPQPGRYEVDHLVSLELGGTNDEGNLWPEPRAGPAGSLVKDRLENYLHAQVCHHRIALATAQDEIASNWWAAYVAAGRP
jgi:hypothetical protein